MYRRLCQTESLTRVGKCRLLASNERPMNRSFKFHRRLRIERLEGRRQQSITINTLVDEADGSIGDGDISLSRWRLRRLVKRSSSQRLRRSPLARTVPLFNFMGEPGHDNLSAGHSAIPSVASMAIGVVVVPAPVAHATKYWRNGVVSGNWNVATNWSSISASDTPTTSGVPVAGEAVNIVNTDGNPHTVTLDVNAPPSAPSTQLGFLTIDQTGAVSERTRSR